MSRGKVLITPRSLTAGGDLAAHQELAPLVKAGYELVAGPSGRVPSGRELVELLDGVVGWLAGVEEITSELLSQASQLRAISRNGVGTDSIDLQAAARFGIEVSTTPGANAQGVAELALALGLAAVRDIVRADRSVRAGGWHRGLGRELSELRIGVVGYGAIGRRVAELFTAVGAQVAFFDPYADDSLHHVRTETLEQLVAQADLLTLHMPSGPDATPILDREMLKLMPHGSVLVNTARSGLVEGAALLEALETGRVSVYAVDAFDSEPPELTALLQHERTILTSHLGGYTDASVRRATEAAVANLLTNMNPESQES